MRRSRGGKTFSLPWRDVADPELANLASLRAFAKAGFASIRDVVDDDGKRRRVIRRDRPLPPPAEIGLRA